MRARQGFSTLQAKKGVFLRITQIGPDPLKAFLSRILQEIPFHPPPCFPGSSGAEDTQEQSIKGAGWRLAQGIANCD